GLDQLGEPDELHARAPGGLAEAALVLVDRLPAVPLDDPGGGVAQPRPARGVVEVRGGLGQAAGLGVLEDPGDGVGRVLLVRADDPARATLDPADDVLAGDRLAVLVADTAARVADQAAAVVEGDVVQRPAAVADRAQDEAALDHLLLAGRDGSQA